LGGGGGADWGLRFSSKAYLAVLASSALSLAALIASSKAANSLVAASAVAESSGSFSPYGFWSGSSLLEVPSLKIAPGPTPHSDLPNLEGFKNGLV
jgi:hypothetical protein